MKTIILDIGGESADWIKSFNTRIKKAKVYVKNPAEAPPGAKLQEGKRGGQYYISDDMERSKPAAQQVKNRVETIFVDSQKFLNVMLMMGDDEYTSTAPTSIEYINGLIKKHNIDLGGVTLNLLPLNISNAFAFVSSNDPTNIYLPATSEHEYAEWVDELKDILKEANYTPEELSFITEDKRAVTIIHEVGHTKVHKFINFKDIKTQLEFQKIEYEKFKKYAQYVQMHYGVSLNAMYESLDEILAEDYRQIVGGSQAKIPNRYLYPTDTITSDRYKYKEGRLNILREMGVF